MTMHAAKGLEFPVVFLTGMEEELFPSNQSKNDPIGLQEERRLCYVAMTRAKEKLYLTSTQQRMIFGQTKTTLPSQFLSEIPDEFIEHTGLPEPLSYVDGDTTLESYHTPSFSSSSSYRAGASGYSFGDRSPSKSTSSGSSFHSTVSPAKSTATKGKQSFRSTPVAKATKEYTQYCIGDKVVHKAFGSGVIQDTKEMGGDVLLEILFDQEGSRKLLRNSVQALLKKTEN